MYVRKYVRTDVRTDTIIKTNDHLWPLGLVGQQAFFEHAQLAFMMAKLFLLWNEEDF